MLLVSLCVLVSPVVSGVNLVKDINAVPTADYAGGSTFDESVTVSSGTLYRMDDGTHGFELWITDGSPAGTRLVRDIRPGPVSSNIAQMTLVAGVAYFWADDGANGFELWRSDGTTAGTTIVANIGAGAAGFPGPMFNSGRMPTIGNIFYFIGFDATAAYLWRSDGNASGTYKVGTFAPSASTFNLRDLMVVGSRLFFLATDTAGEELWVSDGSVAGTRRVTNIPDNGTSPLWGQFTVLGDFLYFTVDDQVHGDELWRVGIDGTGPNMVVDLNNLSLGGGRTAPSHPRGLFVVGSSLIFEATTMTGPNLPNAQIIQKLYRLTAGSNTPVALMDTQFGSFPTRPISIAGSAIFELPNMGSGVWVTDGTTAGTQPVTALNFEVPSAPEVLYRGNEAFFFAAVSPGSPNYYLWRTDGTAAGTRIYLQMELTGTAGRITSFNGRLYFQRETTGSGLELWSTDGTVGGTRILRDVLPGDAGGAGAGTFVVGARMYFTADSMQGNEEPWVTDGTETNTVRLATVPPRFVTEGSRPLMLGSLGTSVFFTADDGVHGEELWISDGSNSGARLVRDISPGSASTRIYSMTTANGFALFSAEDAAGIELWRTDGTTVGTYRLKDINPGTAHSDPMYLGREFPVVNGIAYFVANDGVHGRQLWRSDGTEAGTTMVVETPGNNGVALMAATVNNRIFFLGDGNPVTLYSTDGTAAGTVVVSNTLSVVGSVPPAVFQNRICFGVNVQTAMYELFCSDGIAAGTEQVTDFAALGLSAWHPYVVNNKLIVNAARNGGVPGGGLYVCDGTPSGLTKISDLHLEAPGIPLNGGAQYAFYQSNGGNPDIFVTDGTAAGTRSMLAGTTTPRDLIWNNYAGFGDSVLFTVNELGRGPVLWKTDGTVAGTHYLFDIEPLEGVNGGEPSEFQQAGSRMFFRAGRTGIGEELWTFNATNPNAVDDYAEVAFNTAANINVFANDSDFQGSLAGASISIVTPPTSGSTSINSATGVITYTPNNGYAGGDLIVYRVTDAGGNPSNSAYVSIIVVPAVSTTPPGTAPVPTPNPPSNPPPSGGGGGGGGGALGLEALLLSLLLAWRQRPRFARRPATVH